MDLTEAINARHSVRQYHNKPLEAQTADKLEAEVKECNQKSGLNIQLIKNEPKAFSSFMARYGKFSGVTNYFALIGKKEPGLEEKCGYYGERLVLLAQQLKLNTCWVAMTYSKTKTAFTIKNGEKLCLVIALGYGKTQGFPHKSKKISDVSEPSGYTPKWFHDGVNAALLAPTAMNQQKFKFTLINDNEVLATAGIGFYSKVDLGIVKRHFEIGAGTENFRWK